MVYFSKYQILQCPSFCFFCRLIFTLLIFTPPDCGPTVVWMKSIAWWPMHSSSPPTSIHMQSGAPNFILETRTLKCGQHLGWRTVIVGWKSMLRHCCQPVAPRPHVPWEPFMDGSCATIPCWTTFGSAGYQRSQPVWEGHCSGLLRLVRSWSWLSSLYPSLFSLLR